MNLSTRTKNETLPNAEVSDKLSDAQLLEKFGIKPCFVKIFRLQSDECDAAVIKSSPQMIAGSNRTFDLNREFQGPHFSEKRTGQINLACKTKRLLYYETSPDTNMVKEIQLITLNSDPAEKPSWMNGLIIEPMDIREHLNRFHVPDSDSEGENEGDMAKHKSTSELHLNDRSNQSAKVVLKRKSDLVKQSKRPRRNKPNTSERKPKCNKHSEIDKERDMAIMTHGNRIKHQSISQDKSSQLRLVNKSNQTDSKVLKRKQSNVSKKQEKRCKRNGQNRAVKAINNSDSEIKKNYTDSDLRKKFGIKECFVSIPLIIPEIPKLPQSQSFQVHYGHQFLKEIAQKACLSSRNKVIDLDRLYAETSLSQFSSLRRKNFNRQIREFFNLMSEQDSSIKDIQLISRSEEKSEARRTKKMLWYNNKSKCIIVDATRVVHQLIRKLLKNLNYPLVLVEQNKEADFLAQQLVGDNKIVHEKSQQSDCSNYIEHDSELSQMYKFPLRIDEKLQDLNDDDEGKQPLISDNQIEYQNKTLQNFDDDASTYANHLNLNPTQELHQQLDDAEGKQPLISDNQLEYQNKTLQNFDDDASTYANHLNLYPTRELHQQLDDAEGKQPLISDNQLEYQNKTLQNFDDDASTYANPLKLNPTQELHQQLDDGEGKQPLISENLSANYESKETQNYDDDALTYASFKPCEDLLHQNTIDLNLTLELDQQLVDGKGKQPLISENYESKEIQNYDDDASTYASFKPSEGLLYKIPLDLNLTLELDQQLDNFKGKLPLVSENYESEKVQNFDDASFYASSKPSESLQYEIPVDLNSTQKLQQPFCETFHSTKFKEVTPCRQWPNTILNLFEKPFENDCVNCPPTAETEMNCVPFHLINGDEHIDTTNALKEIYDDYPDCNPPSLNRESLPNIEYFDDASKNKSVDAANECNPPILNREIPLSMKHIDDTSEDNDLNAAIDQFFAIDNDDYSEKNNESYSEECSGADQQL